MNWKYTLFFLFVTCLCCVTFAYRSPSSSLSLSTGYEQLDKSIVDAFNCSPKKTKEVYTSSLELLSRSRKKSSVNSQEWISKAEKLITLSCYNEAMKAYSQKDLKNAIVWCERGLSAGAKNGKISDYNVQDFYTLTKDLKAKVESELKSKDVSYSKQELSHLAKISPDKDSSGRFLFKNDSVDSRNRSYEIVEGPAQDSSGNVYVKVNSKGRGSVKIQYFKGEGWSDISYGRNRPDRFYNTWTECADNL